MSDQIALQMETWKRIYTNNSCTNRLRRFDRYLLLVSMIQAYPCLFFLRFVCFKSQTLAFALPSLHGLHSAIGQATSKEAGCKTYREREIHTHVYIFIYLSIYLFIYLSIYLYLYLYLYMICIYIYTNDYTSV